MLSEGFVMNMDGFLQTVWQITLIERKFGLLYVLEESVTFSPMIDD